VTKSWSVIFLLFFLVAGCNQNEKAYEGKVIAPVASIDEVTSIISNSDKGLVAFDFFAPWCGPCRSLAPVLESIAQQSRSRVIFYRINIDNVPQAAQLFKVDRIPFVVFVKNREVVAALVGIQPREKYLEVISANSVKPAPPDTPSDSI
jgi:thioredoxin 1